MVALENKTLFFSKKQQMQGWICAVGLGKEDAKYFRNLAEVLESNSTLRLRCSLCAFRPTDGKISSLSARCQNRISIRFLTVCLALKRKI